MPNSLLDFVMALARDPAAAARYEADPAGVLAAAQLPGVTIADVNNLMPVVADSLAAASPGFGTPADSSLVTASIWTSGAAAAAFDAFNIAIPAADQVAPAIVSASSVQVSADRIQDILDDSVPPVDPVVLAGGDLPEEPQPFEPVPTAWPDENPHIDASFGTGDGTGF